MSMATNQTVGFRLELARGIYSLLLNVHRSIHTQYIPTVYVQCMYTVYVHGGWQDECEQFSWIMRNGFSSKLHLFALPLLLLAKRFSGSRYNSHATLFYATGYTVGLLMGNRSNILVLPEKNQHFNSQCQQILIGRETEHDVQ